MLNRARSTTRNVASSNTIRRMASASPPRIPEHIQKTTQEPLLFTSKREVQFFRGASRQNTLKKLVKKEPTNDTTASSPESTIPEHISNVDSKSNSTNFTLPSDKPKIKKSKMSASPAEPERFDGDLSVVENLDQFKVAPNVDPNLTDIVRIDNGKEIILPATIPRAQTGPETFVGASRLVKRTREGVYSLSDTGVDQTEFLDSVFGAKDTLLKIDERKEKHLFNPEKKYDDTLHRQHVKQTEKSFELRERAEAPLRELSPMEDNPLYKQVLQEHEVQQKRFLDRRVKEIHEENRLRLTSEIDKYGKVAVAERRSKALAQNLKKRQETAEKNKQLFDDIEAELVETSSTGDFGAVSGALAPLAEDPEAIFARNMKIKYPELTAFVNDLHNIKNHGLGNARIKELNSKYGVPGHIISRVIMHANTKLPITFRHNIHPSVPRLLLTDDPLPRFEHPHAQAPLETATTEQGMIDFKGIGHEVLKMGHEARSKYESRHVELVSEYERSNEAKEKEIQTRMERERIQKLNPYNPNNVNLSPLDLEYSNKWEKAFAEYMMKYPRSKYYVDDDVEFIKFCIRGRRDTFDLSRDPVFKQSLYTAAVDAIALEDKNGFKFPDVFTKNEIEGKPTTLRDALKNPSKLQGFGRTLGQNKQSSFDKLLNRNKPKAEEVNEANKKTVESIFSTQAKKTAEVEHEFETTPQVLRIMDGVKTKLIAAGHVDADGTSLSVPMENGVYRMNTLAELDEIIETIPDFKALSPLERRDLKVDVQEEQKDRIAMLKILRRDDIKLMPGVRQIEKLIVDGKWTRAQAEIDTLTLTVSKVLMKNKLKEQKKLKAIEGRLDPDFHIESDAENLDLHLRVAGVKNMMLDQNNPYLQSSTEKKKANEFGGVDGHDFKDSAEDNLNLENYMKFRNDRKFQLMNKTTLRTRMQLERAKDMIRMGYSPKAVAEEYTKDISASQLSSKDDATTRSSRKDLRKEVSLEDDANQGFEKAQENMYRSVHLDRSGAAVSMKTSDDVFSHLMPNVPSNETESVNRVLEDHSIQHRRNSTPAGRRLDTLDDGTFHGLDDKAQALKALEEIARQEFENSRKRRSMEQEDIKRDRERREREQLESEKNEEDGEKKEDEEKPKDKRRDGLVEISEILGYLQGEYREGRMLHTKSLYDILELTFIGGDSAEEASHRLASRGGNAYTEFLEFVAAMEKLIYDMRMSNLEIPRYFPDGVDPLDSMITSGVDGSSEVMINNRLAKHYDYYFEMLSRKAEFEKLDLKLRSEGFPSLEETGKIKTMAFEAALSVQSKDQAQDPGLLKNAAELFDMLGALKELKVSNPKMYFWRKFLSVIPEKMHSFALVSLGLPRNPVFLINQQGDMNPVIKTILAGIRKKNIIEYDFRKRYENIVAGNLRTKIQLAEKQREERRRRHAIELRLADSEPMDINTIFDLPEDGEDAETKDENTTTAEAAKNTKENKSNISAATKKFVDDEAEELVQLSKAKHSIEDFIDVAYWGTLIQEYNKVMNNEQLVSPRYNDFYNMVKMGYRKGTHKKHFTDDLTQPLPKYSVRRFDEVLEEHRETLEQRGLEPEIITTLVEQERKLYENAIRAIVDRRIARKSITRALFKQDIADFERDRENLHKSREDRDRLEIGDDDVAEDDLLEELSTYSDKMKKTKGTLHEVNIKMMNEKMLNHDPSANPRHEQIVVPRKMMKQRKSEIITTDPEEFRDSHVSKAAPGSIDDIEHRFLRSKSSAQLEAYIDIQGEDITANQLRAITDRHDIEIESRQRLSERVREAAGEADRLLEKVNLVKRDEIRQKLVFGRVISSVGKRVLVEQVGNKAYQNHAEYFDEDSFARILRAAGEATTQIDTNQGLLSTVSGQRVDQDGAPILDEDDTKAPVLSKLHRDKNKKAGPKTWQCEKSRHLDLLTGDYVLFDPLPGRPWHQSQLVSKEQRLVAGGDGVVRAVFKRHNTIMRGSTDVSLESGISRDSTPLCSNLDHIVIVVAAEGHPPFHPFLIDKYLGVAKLNDVQCTIVYNKVDLIETVHEMKKEYKSQLISEKEENRKVSRMTKKARKLYFQQKEEEEKRLRAQENDDDFDEEGEEEEEMNWEDVDEDELNEWEDKERVMKWLRRRKRYNSKEIEEALQAYERLGYKVVRTSARDNVGVDELRDVVSRHHTTMFVGPSGVGKSSLLNVLIPDLNAKVNSLSMRGSGRHTTTTSTLYHLPDGGNIIDTPGGQSFLPPPISPDKVDGLFPEIAEVAKYCRLGARCMHINEPGCAVLEAAKAEVTQLPLTIFDIFDPKKRADTRVMDFWHRLYRGELRQAAAYSSNDPLMLYAQRWYLEHEVTGTADLDNELLRPVSEVSFKEKVDIKREQHRAKLESERVDREIYDEAMNDLERYIEESQKNPTKNESPIVAAMRDYHEDVSNTIVSPFDYGKHAPTRDDLLRVTRELYENQSQLERESGLPTLTPEDIENMSEYQVEEYNRRRHEYASRYNSKKNNNVGDNKFVDNETFYTIPDDPNLYSSEYERRRTSIRRMRHEAKVRKLLMQHEVERIQRMSELKDEIENEKEIFGHAINDEENSPEHILYKKMMAGEDIFDHETFEKMEEARLAKVNPIPVPTMKKIPVLDDDSDITTMDGGDKKAQTIDDLFSDDEDYDDLQDTSENSEPDFTPEEYQRLEEKYQMDYKQSPDPRMIPDPSQDSDFKMLLRVQQEENREVDPLLDFPIDLEALGNQIDDIASEKYEEMMELVHSIAPKLDDPDVIPSGFEDISEEELRELIKDYSSVMAQDMVEDMLMNSVDFDDDDMSGSDMSGSEMSGSEMSGSEFSGSEMSGSELSGSELSGSEISGSDIPPLNNTTTTTQKSASAPISSPISESELESESESDYESEYDQDISLPVDLVDGIIDNTDPRTLMRRDLEKLRRATDPTELEKLQDSLPSYINKEAMSPMAASIASENKTTERFQNIVQQDLTRMLTANTRVAEAIEKFSPSLAQHVREINLKPKNDQEELAAKELRRIFLRENEKYLLGGEYSHGKKASSLAAQISNLSPQAASKAYIPLFRLRSYYRTLNMMQTHKKERYKRKATMSTKREQEFESQRRRHALEITREKRRVDRAVKKEYDAQIEELNPKYGEAFGRIYAAKIEEQLRKREEKNETEMAIDKLSKQLDTKGELPFGLADYEFNMKKERKDKFKNMFLHDLKLSKSDRQRAKADQVMGLLQDELREEIRPSENAFGWDDNFGQYSDAEPFDHLQRNDPLADPDGDVGFDYDDSSFGRGQY